MNLDNSISLKLKKIAKTFDLKILILFGSYANGKNNNNSDYDFVFLPKQFFSINKEIELFDKFEEIFKGKRFDLINLNKNYSIILKYEIFHNGICLYEKKKGTFELLKESSFIDYIDSLTLLEPTKQKFLSSI